MAVIFTAVVLILAVAIAVAVAVVSVLAVSGRRTFPWESFQRWAYVLAIAAAVTAIALSVL
jgi:hypothetical protein